MKTALYYTVGLIVICLACLVGVGRLVDAARSSERALANFRVQNAEALKKSSQLEARLKQLKADGAADYTYQLAVAERSAIPARIERAVAESSVGMPIKDFNSPTSFEMTLVAQHYTNILRFLRRIETDFPEVRLRQVVWAVQGDGSVGASVACDLWVIPNPTTLVATTK